MSLIVGLMIFCVPLPFTRDPDRPLHGPPFWIAVIAAGAWTLFVGRRAWRLLKAGAIRGDRDFDCHTRRMLSRDYADMESATRAARRRKRQR